MPRPRTGVTPQHNVRVPAELWSAAVAKARAEGKTLSKVIVEFLRGYVGEGDGRGMRRTSGAHHVGNEQDSMRTREN